MSGYIDALLPVRRVVDPDPVRRLNARERIDGQAVEPDAVVAADVRDHRQSGRHFRGIDIHAAGDDEERNVAASRPQQQNEKGDVADGDDDRRHQRRV